MIDIFRNHRPITEQIDFDWSKLLQGGNRRGNEGNDEEREKKRKFADLCAQFDELKKKKSEDEEERRQEEEERRREEEERIKEEEERRTEAEKRRREDEKRKRQENQRMEEQERIIAQELESLRSTNQIPLSTGWLNGVDGLSSNQMSVLSVSSYQLPVATVSSNQMSLLSNQGGSSDSDNTSGSDEEIGSQTITRDNRILRTFTSEALPIDRVHIPIQPFEFEENSDNSNPDSDPETRKL